MSGRKEASSLIRKHYNNCIIKRLAQKKLSEEAIINADLFRQEYLLVLFFILFIIAKCDNTMFCIPY